MRFVAHFSKSSSSNPSVTIFIILIEAGMLYALRSSHLASTVAWIPIRETDDLTDSVPFDFVVERMIQVPRCTDGNFMADDFDASLRAAINAMLSH